MILAAPHMSLIGVKELKKTLKSIKKFHQRREKVIQVLKATKASIKRSKKEYAVKKSNLL